MPTRAIHMKGENVVVLDGWTFDNIKYCERLSDKIWINEKKVNHNRFKLLQSSWIQHLDSLMSIITI